MLSQPFPLNWPYRDLQTLMLPGPCPGPGSGSRPAVHMSALLVTGACSAARASADVTAQVQCLGAIGRTETTERTARTARTARTGVLGRTETRGEGEEPGELSKLRGTERTETTQHPRTRKTDAVNSIVQSHGPSSRSFSEAGPVLAVLAVLLGLALVHPVGRRCHLSEPGGLGRWRLSNGR